MANRTIPKLRFKGFYNNWINVKVQDLVSKIIDNRGRNPSYYSEAGHPVIDNFLIQNNLYPDDNKAKRYLDENMYKNFIRHYSKKNDVLITLVGSHMGNLTLMPSNNDEIVQNTVGLRCNNKQNDNFFLLFNLLFNHHRLLDFNLNSARPSLNRTDLLNLRIMSTSLPEQQLIGKFFTELDKLIQLQRKKVLLLKKLKQGYLQKLFPRNNEVTPRLRFAGFHNKWNKFTIDELIKKGESGGTPSKRKSGYYGGNIPFLSIDDVTNSNGLINTTTKSITQDGLKNSSAWIVPKGTLILSMYASVGKIAKANIKLTTSQAFFNMIYKSSITANVMYYVFQYIDFINGWRPFINTGTQGNLNAHTIKSFEVILPSLDEQKKLEHFFKCLDNKIDFQNKKLIYLCKLKKAYLQKMFC